MAVLGASARIDGRHQRLNARIYPDSAAELADTVRAACA
jgi:hypothetical protein